MVVDLPLAYNTSSRTVTAWERRTATDDADSGSLSTRDMLMRIAEVCGFSEEGEGKRGAVGHSMQGVAYILALGGRVLQSAPQTRLGQTLSSLGAAAKQPSAGLGAVVEELSRLPLTELS